MKLRTTINSKHAYCPNVIYNKQPDIKQTDIYIHSHTYKLDLSLKLPYTAFKIFYYITFDAFLHACCFDFMIFI